MVTVIVEGEVVTVEERVGYSGERVGYDGGRVGYGAKGEREQSERSGERVKNLRERKESSHLQRELPLYMALWSHNRIWCTWTH